MVNYLYIITFLLDYSLSDVNMVHLFSHYSVIIETDIYVLGYEFLVGINFLTKR